MAELAFQLPSLGMSMEEASIEEWLVEVGDIVTEGQELVTIETDKVHTELPSPYSGKVTAIHIAGGEVVTVGTLLATIEG